MSNQFKETHAFESAWKKACPGKDCQKTILFFETMCHTCKRQPDVQAEEIMRLTRENQRLFTESSMLKHGERIICSAVHYADGKEHKGQPDGITSGFVVAGRRHDDCYTAMDNMGFKYVEELCNREHQGFITNTNRFVSRAEAYRIASAAGQLLLSPMKDCEGLTSEDLY